MFVYILKLYGISVTKIILYNQKSLINQAILIQGI